MRSKISLLACSLLFMLSCGTSPVSVEENEVFSAQLDGKEIFKTVFFNLGDVAKDIPSFKDNVELITKTNEENPEFLEEYNMSIDRYVEQIQSTNPGYFDQLKEAVYSKDFLDIKSAMQFGDLLILPTVIQTNLETIEYEPLKADIKALDIASVDFKSEEELKELTKSLLKVLSKHEEEAEKLDINNGKCFAFAFAVAVAVVGNFVYAVNVAWTGNLNWNVNWSIPLQGGTYDYDHYVGEQLIKEIALVFN